MINYKNPCSTLRTIKSRITTNGIFDSKDTGDSVKSRITPDVIIEKDLVSDFKKAFPKFARATTREQILRFVNISPPVRDWYISRKDDLSTLTGLPAFMGETPEELKAWRDTEAERFRLKEYEKKWADEIRVASDNFKIAINKVNSEKKSTYGGISKILIINQVTVNQISPEDQFEIAMEGSEEKRDTLQKELVLKEQKRLYALLKDGKFVDPFK